MRRREERRRGIQRGKAYPGGRRRASACEPLPSCLVPQLDECRERRAAGEPIETRVITRELVGVSRTFAGVCELLVRCVCVCSVLLCCVCVCVYELRVLRVLCRSLPRSCRVPALQRMSANPTHSLTALTTGPTRATLSRLVVPSRSRVSTAADVLTLPVRPSRPLLRHVLRRPPPRHVTPARVQASCLMESSCSVHRRPTTTPTQTSTDFVSARAPTTREAASLSRYVSLLLVVALLAVSLSRLALQASNLFHPQRVFRVRHSSPRSLS